MKHAWGISFGNTAFITNKNKIAFNEKLHCPSEKE